ncbi:MerR family transcriptional regulator [Candidatus Omnitrophota bacterium]
MNNRKKLIFAKEIPLKFDISYPTVSYYTNLGLFTVVRRKANKRLYYENEVRVKLDKIFRLSNEGYPLRLICKKLR